MKHRKVLIVVAAVVIAATALALAANMGNSGRLGRDSGVFSRITGAFSARDENTIRVSGNIELIDVEVSFKIGGRVVERTVDEGDSVQPNQRIASLECEDLKRDVAAREADYRAAEAAWEEAENGSRKEEKEAARAALEKADQAYKELEHGSRPEEVKAAEATLQSTKVEKERLSDELGRAKRLYDDHAISEEDYKRQEAAYRVAESRWREAAERSTLIRIGPRVEQIAQAKAALQQATWQSQLVEAGARAEVRKQMLARRDEAKAAWELAKTRLGYAEVFAPPWPGVVMAKNVEPTEYVSPGTPVVTIGDLAHPWLRAYVDAENAQRLKYGQRARVTSTLMPGKVFEGRIGFIASEAEFTPKSVQTEKERSKLVYRIKIYVDNPKQELKRGMPADADILLDSAPVDNL